MKNYGRFVKLIIPHWFLFVCGIGSMLLTSIFEASPLALVIPVVEKIISGKDLAVPQGKPLPEFAQALVDKVNSLPPMMLLELLVITLIVVISLKGFFDFLMTYLMSDVSQRVVRDIKNDIYKKLLHLSMDFYSHNPTGILMSRITHDSAVIRDAISTGIADTFMMPIKIITYLVTLIMIKVYFNIPARLIIISLVVFPLVLLPVVKVGKKLRKLSMNTQKKIADINNMLLETISGIKLVKAFNMQGYEENKFRKHNEEFYKLNMKSVHRMKIVSPITEVVSISCVAAILWIAGTSIISGELAAGPFIAFIAAVLAMIKPVKKLSNVYGINQQALAAADRIYEILDTKITVKERESPESLDSFHDKIVFKNVSFAYDKGKDKVLKNIDLEIKKGEIIALVGPSGGGKTTLVNFIPRFYDPDEGTVEIDGKNVKEFSLSSLRENIGLVTQETILFNDTLKANLCYGHDDVDEKRLVAAAEAANAHMFIKGFPEQYDTIIGERGVRISGGQRQRLALARAVYKNPPILILDEATSQLDSESEKLVQEAINNLMEGRTVIAIAHRLSTITHANKIVVVDDGIIADSGTHSDLLKRNKLYKRLYELQFQDQKQD
ncbi:MAG: ABC transporter ATP-binding protein [Candidatus Omnitrophica bacterium]|nr:ABC transporter ATP-binding protein [Candidatus Omnitrophota bacterium]